jgi:hypothetical protein
MEEVLTSMHCDFDFGITHQWCSNRKPTRHGVTFFNCLDYVVTSELCTQFQISKGTGVLLLINSSVLPLIYQIIV